MIPLAGALGAGTIFALFFVARRKAGFAVFEVFVVVAVLTAVATTAYLCIALLHDNKPISDHVLTQTAMPLIVAVFFLAFVSIGSRIPGSFERAWPILGLAVMGSVAAVWLASSAWTTTPDDAGLVAILILAVGALLGLIAWGADSANIRSERKLERRQVERLVGRGYVPPPPGRRAVVRHVEGGGLLTGWHADSAQGRDRPLDSAAEGQAFGSARDGFGRGREPGARAGEKPRRPFRRDLETLAETVAAPPATRA